MPLIDLPDFTINEGQVLQQTITLDAPAAVDTDVTVTSNNPAVTVPMTVTILAGQTSANFNVTAIDDANSVDENVTLSFTLDAQTETTAVLVNDNDGTPGDDLLTGTAAIETISGLAGSDTFSGNLQGDTLIGGDGNDRFNLGAFTAVTITELANAGSGIDTVTSTTTRSLMSFANVENLTLLGVAAISGAGNGLNNVLTGNAAANSLAGDAGNDTLNGLGGNDVLNGGLGADRLDGGTGANTEVGGAGNDVFVATRSAVAATATTIADFGSRYFTAVLTGGAEVPPVMTMATGLGSFVLNRARTVLTNVTTTTGLDFGGMGPDGVTGFHLHNAPVGVNGPIVWDIRDDPTTVVNGVTESFTARWLAGNGLTPAMVNQLLLGRMYENIHTNGNLGGEIRGQVVAVAGDTGADRIDLTAFNIGSLAAFQAVTANIGGSARMTTFLNGVASTLTIAGVLEATLVPGNFIFAGNVTQTLNGTANADDLFGAGGNDTLNGGTGNDRLFGENHNDTLRGMNGNDILIGGLGRDIMIGGLNNDIFRFAATADSAVANPDVITDFDDFGNDSIDLSALFGPAMTYRHNLAFTAAGQVRINDIAGPDVIVQVNTGGSLAADFQLRLSATTLASMTASDFIL